jgi:hypothetical protein
MRYLWINDGLQLSCSPMRLHDGPLVTEITAAG